MKNPVRINMKKDELIIMISEGAEHDEIIDCLNSKITALKKLYKSEKTPISVMGKVLKNKEIDEIKKIIKENIDVQVTFDSSNELGLHGIRKVFEKNVNNSETQFYKGSLRSGQKVEFEGSVVVIGDINGGAEVIAGENIAVLGTLRGLAHAGAKGNKKAIIASMSIDCPQLRIANYVKEMEKEDLVNGYKYAYVEEENIVME